jgi:hypothetical protein
MSRRFSPSRTARAVSAKRAPAMPDVPLPFDPASDKALSAYLERNPWREAPRQVEFSAPLRWYIVPATSRVEQDERALARRLARGSGALTASSVFERRALQRSQERERETAESLTSLLSLEARGARESFPPDGWGYEGGSGGGGESESWMDDEPPGVASGVRDRRDLQRTQEESRDAAAVLMNLDWRQGGGRGRGIGRGAGRGRGRGAGRGGRSKSPSRGRAAR